MELTTDINTRLPDEIWSIIYYICIENRIYGIYLISKGVNSWFQKYVKSRMDSITELIPSGNAFERYVLNVCVYRFYINELTAVFSGGYLLRWDVLGRITYYEYRSGEEYYIAVGKMITWIKFLLPNVYQPETYRCNIIHSPEVISLSSAENSNGDIFYFVRFRIDGTVETGRIKYFRYIQSWSNLETMGSRSTFNDHVSGNFRWQLDVAMRRLNNNIGEI